MHTCGTWLLLYATPTHLPSICPFTHLYVLISALSNPMYLPPALWAWIRAPATHFLGARILITSTTSTPPAALSALPQHLPPPFSVIVLSSQYLFQRGPIWVAVLANLVYTYFTRGIEDSVWVWQSHKPLEKGGSAGAIYLPYLVLHHTAWSTQKGMWTL